MRSEMVFRAQDFLVNRFQLCQTTAKVTRRLHFLSTNTTDAINDAFLHLAESTEDRSPTLPLASPPSPSLQ